MEFSNRTKRISESVTLKLAGQARKLVESGQKIANLSAGQLPFRPPLELINELRAQLDFVKSYQYSPVAGLAPLRKRILQNHGQSRQVELPADFGCLVASGGKHALSNVLAALINPADEVVLIAPYWTSYPELVKLYGGVPKVVRSSFYDVFVPRLADIGEAITDKTRAIIINSPHNPTGIQYDHEWMEGLADLMKGCPRVALISDEIYCELFYFDPRPTYFYQIRPELLDRTIVIDGISKSLACTGLRLGWCLGTGELIANINKLQGQTTSGANALVQEALLALRDGVVQEYLVPVKKRLRENADTLKDIWQRHGFAHLWYRPSAAFYYLADFSKMPIMERYGQDKDNSPEVCRDLLEQKQIACSPGSAFGSPNSLRLSLVIEPDIFASAVERLVGFFKGE